MKRLRLVLTLGLLSLAAGLQAATTPNGRVEELGQGLTYVRPAGSSAESLALLKGVSSGPAVLDLRYFPAGDYTAEWLAAIKAFATPQHICLVLLSPDISPDLAIGFSAGIPSCITIGRASPALKTDIAVETNDETDRKAWESIGQGADLAKLTTAALDKPRYDEAVLAKEHAAEVNGTATPGDESSDPDGATEPENTPKKAPKPPAKPKPLIDAVLQRAVQIDRGLLALRKL